MAELSIVSSCCNISLRCSWNTTSKPPSSSSGRICQWGWAHGDQAQSGPNTHLWETPTPVPVFSKCTMAVVGYPFSRWEA